MIRRVNRSAIAGRSLAGSLLALAFAACSPPATPADSGTESSADALDASDAADVTLPDAPTVDTPEGGSDTGVPPCGSDAACSDGLYCNGVERCAPGTQGADARGCIAGTPPCTGDAGTRCDEAMDRCVSTDCADPDHDHDGENKPGCGGNDCNDNDATVHHGAAEVCDGAGHDEDCDPCTVASRPSAGSPTDGDTDADGFISTACTNAYVGNAPTTCDPVAVRVGGGLVTGSDCAPDDPNRRPNQVEACNHVDDNCNGQTDEGITTHAYYPDTDGDTFGAAASSPVNDCAPPAGYVTNALDCDDGDANTYPGASEVCDGRDNDCSLGGDGTDPSEDADGDGHTPPGAACAGGPFPPDDCDDADPSVHPGATELCDRVDSDCSLASRGPEVSEDADLDGHAGISAACTGGPLPKDDCNDGDPSVYAGAPEACDRVDSNCSSGGGVALDEDADNDGYAPTGAGCTGGALPRTDCNDANAAIHPGVTEVCDGVDQDCNGTTDDDPPSAPVCGTHRLGCTAGTCLGHAAIAIGGSSACAVRSGGVWCWGYNGAGQLGDGTTTNRATPVAVSGVTGAVEVTMGPSHACARSALGQVWCWGQNPDGRLGDGSTTNRTSAVTVANINDAIQIAAGFDHTCALRRGGSISCWGYNQYGQLGDGTAGNTRLTAVAVYGVSDAVEIAAGRSATCARRATGEVLCWGANESGQMGNGTLGTASNFYRQATAMPVSNVADARAIAVGAGDACARRATGEVLCWGANDSGRLGDGTGTRRLTPVTVVGINDATDVSVASATSFAQRGAGAAGGWGDNGYGQLGNGTTNTPQFAPTYVLNLADAVQFAAGGGFACATRPAGVVSCWGDNQFGELGDGTTTARLTPTNVTGLP